MGAFLKFFIIAAGVYYLLKLIIRALFPFLVQKTFDKMQKEAQKQQQAQQKKDGEVSIDKNPDKKGNPNKKDVGDYVDFEEID